MLALDPQVENLLELARKAGRPPFEALMLDFVATLIGDALHRGAPTAT